MKKIANIVLNSFTNDSRVLKTSQSLLSKGFSVTVVALHEGDLKENDEVGGVLVHRVKLSSRGWPKYKAIQLIKYLEFVVRVVRTYRKYDVLHCNDLNALPIGVIIKLAFNRSCRVVYDAHEFETEVEGLSALQKKLLSVIERLCIRFSDAVITVSNSIADEYAKLYNIPKPAVVLNCPKYRMVVRHDIFRNKFDLRGDQIIFLYQGILSPGRGVEILLEAFHGLSTDKFILVVMGYGPLVDLVKDRSEQCGIIFYHPAVPPDVLLDYTSSADYGVALIADTCLSYRYCLPNKVFEYLMARLPVIVSDLPELSKMVNDYGVGVVLKDNTPEGFLSLLHAQEWHDQCAYVTNIDKVRPVFCWEKQEKVLLGIYSGL